MYIFKIRERLTLLSFLFMSVFLFPALSQQIESMEFRNKPVADILLALAEFSDQSIITDATVTGYASYYFSETDFYTALEVFLAAYNLYYTVKDGIYYVSKIKSAFDPERNTLSIDVEDTDILFIVRSLSKTIGKTILYDALPSERITLHSTGITPENLINLIVKKLGNFELESGEDYFYIKKTATPASVAGRVGSAEKGTLSVENDLYSIDQKKRPLFELIDELFQGSGREYSIVTNTNRNTIVERIRYSNKTFDRLLKLILEQADVDFKIQDGIYYIFESSQRNLLNKLKTTVTVPLKYLNPVDIQNLFPPDILSSRVAKIDTTARSIILTGSVEEIGSVREFIRLVDRPLEGNSYYRYDLAHLSSTTIKDILPALYRNTEIILIPQSNSFVILMSEENKKLFDEYINLVVVGQDTTPISLKYIKAEDLMGNLPPSVAEDDLSLTSDPSVVFFKGSQEKLELFENELNVLDQPAPQIRYQLLIIQYSEGNSLGWQNQGNSLVALEYPQESESTYLDAFIGNLGSLLDLNFDVFTTLGAKIALELNLALSENKANVLTDTSLCGLSGETVSFQDTETYRYRDLEVVDGEEQYTGVTREVSTGLIVSINGWVSGDGMITMEVDATTSKRGTDTTQTAGSLPPTSEKVVSSLIRTASGEPVILSGLYRWDTTTIVDKTPILGDIPILGLLFQGRTETKTKSELVIYIMPYVEVVEGGARDSADELNDLYKNLFLPTLEKSVPEER